MADILKGSTELMKEGEGLFTGSCICLSGNRKKPEEADWSSNYQRKFHNPDNQHRQNGYLSDV